MQAIQGIEACKRTTPSNGQLDTAMNSKLSLHIFRLPYGRVTLFKLLEAHVIRGFRVRQSTSPYVDDKPASRTSFFDLGRNDLLVISSYSLLNIVAVETQCAGGK